MLADNFGQTIKLVLYGIRDAIVISSFFTPIASTYYALVTSHSSAALEVVPALLAVSVFRK